MNKNFTKLEALILICVIALIMSLILPAFLTTRDKSARKPCTNNLKQMGVKMFMYFEDHSIFTFPKNTEYKTAKVCKVVNLV